jgi:hypothetical protein
MKNEESDGRRQKLGGEEACKAAGPVRHSRAKIYSGCEQCSLARVVMSEFVDSRCI